MSLKMKITLGVTASVLFTMLAGLFAMRIFVVQGFSRLEDERAFRNIDRCVNALKNEQEHLDSLLHNLSSSDAAYRFAADRDKRFSPGYFSWEALKAGNLNCVAMYDPAGELIGSGAFDLNTREAIPLKTLLPAGLPKMKDAGNTFSGIVMTPLGPMLLCARSILNSQGWGPSRGILLAGILHSAQNIERRFETDREANIIAAQGCGVSMESVRCYLDARDIPSLLNGILDSGRRAARLVANMLSFARGGSSVSQMASLPEMMDRAVDIASTDYDMKKKYDFRHIEIIREYAPDLPLVSCAPGEIEQVLLNMLQNAAQALAKDQYPEHSPRIVLRLYTDQGLAVLEVEDNGPGMEDDLRRKVFEPFFTTKSPGEGTGLGLSLSYFIITNNHHGAIRVESEPGQGARFIVSLPLNASSPTVQKPAAAS